MTRAFSISCPVYGGGPAPDRKAGYDAAGPDGRDGRHWRHATDDPPRVENTPAVRRTLRERSKQEFKNNPFVAGAVRTLVADTVGTGARLQMLTPDEGLNRAVEDLWASWAAAADWPLVSRVMAGVRYVAGECFAVFRDSKRLARLGQPVTVDLKLIDPARVHDPFWAYTTRPTGDDGVECDEDGEVVAYRILEAHPNDYWLGMRPDAVKRVGADYVLHWYVPDEPDQLRGVTPFAPALTTFAQVRRFTTATLTAAEVAAMLAGVLELPEATLADGAAPTFDTMDTVELVRGMLLTVPGGGKVTQFKPEQPTTNYDTFVRAKLREAGRAIGMPLGKLLGDHSAYNYSSARMDDGPYWKDRDIERQGLEAKVFDPFLYAWLNFAKFALPGLVAYEGRFWSLKHKWHYDAKPVIDPVKDATGDELNLTNGSDTLDAIAARDGTTVAELLDRRAAVRDMFVERNLPLPPWLAGSPTPDRSPADGPQSQPTEATADA